MASPDILESICHVCYECDKPLYGGLENVVARSRADGGLYFVRRDARLDTDVVRIQDPNARITKPLPRRQWRYRLPLFALNSFNTTITNSRLTLCGSSCGQGHYVYLPLLIYFKAE